MEYRILIVDEDAAARRRYAEALIASPPAIGVSYKISATGSAASAQLQATRHDYHMMLATLRPNNDILGLAERLYSIYPDLRLALVSDHAPDQRTTRRAANLKARLIVGNLGPEQICQLVAESLGLTQRPSEAVAEAAPTRPVATLADVQLMLDVLRRQCSAQLAILADNVGNIIAERGDNTGLELPSLTSLLAGSFMNSIELGRVLRDPETIHLNVHEGDFYDVYTTNVGNDRLLALVFDRQFVNPKLGLVWLLLKRSAGQLRQMRIDDRIGRNSVLSEQFSASLNDEFDRLFGDELIQAE